MRSVPYWNGGDAEAEAAAERTRARRGGTLFNLDRILLHSPPAAAGWTAYMGPIRNDLALPARYRELAMCAVAQLNDAPYEFHHHAPLLLKAGASAAQVDALADVDAAIAAPGLFDAAELAVLRFSRDSTRHVAVRPEVMAEVRAAFPDPRQTVELILVVAAYNMVSRVLVAAGVEIEGEEASA
ncbi:carboxymuconolactone decarboxylase family protein [Phenylobacterium sp.]|uniref:carboxymuconolactone decarboxylase family protein n=1 Tax=Phenylobacterium sp. TaxID=1871053 RepID=UPI0027372C3A|nr:carboxymuconolactone decarboxylase family protein [Phenylobacterium sp.]MDP3659622.1 carboxymuconolactone decarboxylase family protein [Phenylobacterium sp.]